MRSPEQRNHTNRTGQNYDNDKSSRLRTPGAFTVLPPDEETPPDPPLAPQPYRLTPSARRHKNMSFAILAEHGSAPGSRSPSPTGRVSPFRGRGFNPAGSRHASPVPSPPPEESPRHSKIPRLSRRGSATAFGEKVTDYQSSPNRRKLNAQLSQSLTNIAPRKVAAKPPPSPRRAQGYAKPAFQRLSPIAGSSPEPSQSQSSPRISTSEKSKFTSPNRSKSFVNRPPRNPASKNGSRNVSREPSPSKNPASPTRIPVQKFKNVQAKVNSFSRTKPKVPPKPQVLSEETTEESDVGTSRRMSRRGSVTSRTTVKSVNSNSNQSKTSKSATNGNSSGSKNTNGKTSTMSKTEGNKDVKTKDTSSNSKPSDNGNNTKASTSKNTEESEASTTQEEIKKSESMVRLSDLLQPSTTAVVSSTTTTVTQPLKIEAKFDTESLGKPDNKTIAPMVDGHVLSATSVSNAMNKMNDTVLNTQTLIKESGLTKLSPAASAIIAMSKEESRTRNNTVTSKNENGAKTSTTTSSKEESGVRMTTMVLSKEETTKAKVDLNPALDTKNATTALPTVEQATTKENVNSNHVTSTGIIPSARVLEQHVQNNMSKLISPDHKLNSLPKSANDRLIEARTVVAHDVKPIKITVKEKPMDEEVQSGNIRFDTTNGLSERPSLPPPHQPSNDPQPEPPEPPKGNVCTRLLTTCKKKMSCKGCKKEEREPKAEEPKKVSEEKEKTGCFNCRKKKQQPDVTINIEEDPSEPKKKLWDRMKCCGRNRVSDTTSCFPTGKRKESWVGERRDSILSEAPVEKSNLKTCCSGFWRKLFCLDRCRKKPKMREIQDSRRESMMSKKKSLTSSVPVEDVRPKIDPSLVEHTSHMKAAIPVLPVGLAWFCLVMNCIAPGTGTIFSGLFCLCIGKPRFSQKDGARPRIWAFIIDLVIGFGQFFTVLFCLVGWGWSIWWGVIMLKIAKKNRKIKALEANALDGSRQVAPANQNHSSRDPERGS